MKKLWSTKTNLCMGSCDIDGYCISMAFVPGGRYVLVGTKEGYLKVRDTCVISNPY